MPKQRNQLSFIFLILFLVSASSFQSCGMFHRSTQRKIEQKQKKEEKAEQKEYAKAKKQHLKNQHQNTRKMMARTDKKAKKLNTVKQRRLFNRGACR